LLLKTNRIETNGLNSSAASANLMVARLHEVLAVYEGSEESRWPVVK
jgi:hypothetical protein